MLQRSGRRGRAEYVVRRAQEKAFEAEMDACHDQVRCRCNLHAWLAHLRDAAAQKQALKRMDVARARRGVREHVLGEFRFTLGRNLRVVGKRVGQRAHTRPKGRRLPGRADENRSANQGRQLLCASSPGRAELIWIVTQCHVMS